MADGTNQIALVSQGDALESRLGTELVEAGFDVTAVESAEDCLHLVEDGRIDGIVSEFELPDIDGIRLLRSIRVSYPVLPFILIPVDGSETMAGEAVAAGVSGYVPSDADAETVIHRLRESLERERPLVKEEYQHRYRHLIEVSPAPINLFDETGESIWCNRAALELLGLDGRDELIGHSIFEFIHPDDHELARQELETVIDEGTSVGPTQMKLRRPDGEIRHIQVSTAIGNFLGADIGQAVVVDVTPLREAQYRLREERQVLENALDALQDVFYVIDADGNLVRWNETASSVTGYDDDELDAMNIADFFAEEEFDRVRESIATVLEKGADTIRARLVTAEGETLPYEFRGRRLTSRDDRAEQRVVGIGRDISEQIERERQLKVLERWLRHNIRNEMNVIQGVAELIHRGEVDDVTDRARQIQEHAEHLVEQANRERELVSMLTNPPEHQTHAVAELIEGLVAECRERYPEAEIEITQAEDVDVRAIPDLAAAVEELVENAIEHNDSDVPTVSIDITRNDDDRAMIRISDNGPGIPEEEREILLLDRDIDQLHHGFGLGLLFVYWVLQVSGGDITFAENEPQGSIVTLSLQQTHSE